MEEKTYLEINLGNEFAISQGIYFPLVLFLYAIAIKHHPLKV